MNVFMNLISLYNQLPPDSTYRAVIREIFSHMDDMADATIFDVAEMTAASRTTIWRMLKMAGYHSYSEFHHELSKIITQYSYYNWGLPTSGTSDAGEILHMAPQLLNESAGLLEKYITEELLENIAELLNQAERISLYDFPSTSAYFLIQNLVMSGKNVGSFQLWPKMMEDAKSLCANSVVFAYPLESQDMKDMSPVFQTVKDSGATLILGSVSGRHYSAFADILLFPGKPSLSYPFAVRYAFEMFLVMVSELFRNTYMHKKPDRF